MSKFRANSHRTSFLAWGVLLSIFTLVWCCGSAAAADKPYYEGKNIRILIPYSPGGTSDIFARLLARYMSQFIPGNPAIIVQNMPGGGGLVTMNYLYNIAKPNGLTFGHTSVPGVRDQLIGNPGVKFDFRKFDYLGSGGPTYQVFAMREALPYKTLGEMKKAKKTVFIGIGSKGSTTSIVTGILKREGFNVKGVSGYRGSAPRSAAVIKGEVDATLFESVTATREQKNLRGFFWVASKAKLWNDLPNLSELPFSDTTRSLLSAVTTPVNLAHTFLAPPNTPPERLKILRQAFEKTVKLPEFVAKANQIHMPVEWLSAKETKAKALVVLDTPPEGVAALRKIVGMK